MSTIVCTRVCHCAGAYEGAGGLLHQAHAALQGQGRLRRH